MNRDEVEKAYQKIENVENLGAYKFGIKSKTNDGAFFRSGFYVGYISQDEKHKAEIAELMEGLKYIECLDVNPNTTELSSTARCRMASQKAKELLSQFKRHINT